MELKVRIENLDNLINAINVLNENFKIGGVSVDAPKEVKNTQEKALSLEDVREIFIKTSGKDGVSNDDIKKLLNSFNANKVSEIDPSDYERVIEELEKL